MNVTLPARLIELFGRFRQLNSILNENWRDVASKDFFSNFIDPVNSGWKTFHRQTEDASQTIRRLNSSVESNAALLRKLISTVSNELYHNSLEGQQHYTVYTDDRSVDVLVPLSECSGNQDEMRAYLSTIVDGVDDDTPIEVHGTLR